MKVSLQAIEPEDITSVDYTLTGVATSVDLSQPYLALTSTPGGTLAGSIASLTASDGQLVGTDDTQVLGINLSTPPVLTINVTLAAGTLRTLELDVAEVLDELQASTTAQPLTLHAIMSIGMGEPTGSIEPWEPGWDEDLKGE